MRSVKGGAGLAWAWQAAQPATLERREKARAGSGEREKVRRFCWPVGFVVWSSTKHRHPLARFSRGGDGAPTALLVPRRDPSKQLAVFFLRVSATPAENVRKSGGERSLGPNTLGMAGVELAGGGETRQLSWGLVVN